MKKTKKELKGLGGWLILLQIGIIGSIFSYIALANSLEDININLQSDALQGLVSIIDIGWIISIIILILFYTKNRYFPLLTKIHIWGGYIILIITYSELMPYEVEIDNFKIKIIFSLIISILWTLYLSKSKRVKNTFTN